MAISGLSPATIADPKNPLAASAAASSSSANTPVVSTAGNALNKLANDFDSFLLLLTTQLQNQDPLEPMDSKEFTSQLVQFTSVEQSIQSNKNLEKLISLTSGNTSSAAFDYIGREIRTNSNSTNLSNGLAAWSYEVDPTADSSAVTVLDAKGNAVFTQQGLTGAGVHNFSWDGKDKNGNAFPDGVYSLNVSALSASKKPVNATVFTTGVVTDVEISGDEPSLLIGGVKIALKNVLSVMDSNSSSAALNYIGREVRTINNSTNLTSSIANWTYEVDPKATSSVITVKDRKGNVVLEQEGQTEAGILGFTWGGVDKNGDLLPDGVYSVNVTARDKNDVTVNTRVFTKGTVTSVDTAGNEPVLVIGDVKVSLKDVLTVTDPATTASNTTTGGSSEN